MTLQFLVFMFYAFGFLWISQEPFTWILMDPMNRYICRFVARVLAL